MKQEEIIWDFIDNFCNNHNHPIRFLRGIFYDEQDGAETILEWLKTALQSYRQSILEEVEAALPIEKPEINYNDEQIKKASTLQLSREMSKIGFNSCRTETLEAIKKLKDK